MFDGRVPVDVKLTYSPTFNAVVIDGDIVIVDDPLANVTVNVDVAFAHGHKAMFDTVVPPDQLPALKA
jgi:hypothetical protein